MTDGRKALTVTQLNEYVKMLLDNSPVLTSVCVFGEISNFTNHYKTGHFYFTLKDENASVKAVMFRSSAEKIKFTPSNGMKVTLYGKVSAFVRDGVYQIYVNQMEPFGIGSLYLAYGQLKERLEKEGVFDPEKKRPLPKYPVRVGVITSPDGAALQDILNISKRRFPLAEIVLYPALVQGAGAAASLKAGLSALGDGNTADVIILGRGGGSLEDLWAFNDAELAYAIRSSKVPVVSAVGHETDFTIADFAADLRAPTPSAAAELVFPDGEELCLRLLSDEMRLKVSIKNILEQKRASLSRLAESGALCSYAGIFERKREAISAAREVLVKEMRIALMKTRGNFEKSVAMLNAMSPLSLLSKGYVIVRCGDAAVRSAAALHPGDPVTLLFGDGTASAEITDVFEGKAKNPD